MGGVGLEDGVDEGDEGDEGNLAASVVPTGLRFCAALGATGSTPLRFASLPHLAVGIMIIAAGSAGAGVTNVAGGGIATGSGLDAGIAAVGVGGGAVAGGRGAGDDGGAVGAIGTIGAVGAIGAIGAIVGSMIGVAKMVGRGLAGRSSQNDLRALPGSFFSQALASRASFVSFDSLESLPSFTSLDSARADVAVIAVNTVSAVSPVMPAAATNSALATNVCAVFMISAVIGATRLRYQSFLSHAAVQPVLLQLDPLALLRYRPPTLRGRSPCPPRPESASLESAPH